jgi:ribosomal protein L17
MKRKDFVIKEADDKESMLSVKIPDYEQLEEADKVYASKVASLVRESGKRKLLLRQEVDTFIRETKIWTTEDEDKVAELNIEIDGLLNKLRKGGLKVSEGREICIKIGDKRKEMVSITQKRQIFDDTTIESLSESERTDYLIYSSTVSAESGNTYWESLEDMKNDKISEAYRKASTIMVEMMYGINNEFEKRLPENRWLKKYNFVDDELNYTDRKTGARVDKTGKPIIDSTELVKKYIDNLQGEIKEEQPFVDDETGSPVVSENKQETVDVENTTV